MMNDPDMIVDQEPGMEDVDVTAPDVEANGDAVMTENTYPYGIGNYKINVSDKQFPYFGQLLAGIVLLIAVLLHPDEFYVKDNFGFGIAASVIAILLSLAGLRLIQLSDLYDQQLFALPLIGVCTIGYLFNLICVIWWTIAVGILTFDGPFLVTGNGYFAVWAGFFFALSGLGVTTQNFKETDQFMRLATCCIVTICATPVHFGELYSGEAYYAMVLACLTLAFAVSILSFGGTSALLPAGKELVILGGLAVLWVVEAALATFRGPFTETGNGFFASWGAAVITVMLAASK